MTEGMDPLARRDEDSHLEECLQVNELLLTYLRHFALNVLIALINELNILYTEKFSS